MPNFSRCLNCNTQLNMSKYYHAKYCGDDCRNAFNDRRRKIDRAFRRASAAVDLLNSFLSDVPELSDHARVYLFQLNDESTRRLGSEHWVCTNCGQERFMQPHFGDNCSFCGEYRWRIKIHEAW